MTAFPALFLYSRRYRFLPHAKRHYSRLVLVENDFSFFDIGTNPITRNELSFQQRETQWVKQSALNHPLKRPGTVHRIVSLFGQ